MAQTFQEVSTAEFLYGGVVDLCKAINDGLYFVNF